MQDVIKEKKKDFSFFLDDVSQRDENEKFLLMIRMRIDDKKEKFLNSFLVYDLNFCGKVFGFVR
jgi:hypothetical protein